MDRMFLFEFLINAYLITDNYQVLLDKNFLNFLKFPLQNFDR